MCGIAGFLTTNDTGSGLREALVPMIRSLEHRGPDQEGAWISPEDGLALGFRRLAIVDLSEEGHQPMKSASGRFTLTFNGEVYNFRELRAGLEAKGHRFRGHSDTEVILASFEEWGIQESLGRFNGMFAIAVWDREKREVVLARDRMGIKPLYLFSGPGIIAWGSEIKALQALSTFDRTIDPAGLEAYFRYLYVPAPLTIFKRVRKLLPGTYLTLRDVESECGPEQAYWSAEDAFERGSADRIERDEDAVEQLEALLSDSVSLRMISDVPLGALLSGGIDSSTVVALMREHASGPVKTFTIGFDQREHDETEHARSISDHLDTDHTELRLNGSDALDVIPKIAEMFDEPHADPSQLPTYLVSHLARSKVTVALSGDGGDELFAGYNRYRFGVGAIERFAAVPRFARRAFGSGLQGAAGVAAASAYRAAGAVLPGLGKTRLVEDKVRKMSDLLRADGPEGMYRSLMSAWQNPEELLTTRASFADRADAILRGGRGSLLERMMLADQITYLPDDLLAKVDRASMAVSLEARVPILDHRIVELSWRMPPSVKLRGDVTKWVLRQVLYRRVPKELVERPKTGFSVPLDEWLRGPLRSWADDLLSPDALKNSENLRAEAITVAWNRFKRGSGSALAIWTVLLYRAWAERWTSR